MNNAQMQLYIYWAFQQSEISTKETDAKNEIRNRAFKCKVYFQGYSYTPTNLKINRP